MANPALAGSVVGAAVTKADGTLLYGRGESIRVVPGSNQKLFTTAYALETLGLDHTPQTRVWKESDRLVVDAPGDPSLTFDDLQKAKKQLNLTKSMPVYLRRAYAPGVPPSWEFDDLPNKYAAQISAFACDRGSFELWAIDGKAVLLPASFGVEVVRRPGKERRIDYNPFTQKVFVWGPIPSGRTRLDTLAHPDPAWAAIRALGAVSYFPTSSLPSGSPTLVLKGKPLSDLLWDTLSNSDNNFAEHLLLMAASRQGALSPKKEYDEASERLSKFMGETVGIDKADLRPYDGSGLSRHNLVTARATAKLLSWAQTRPWSKEWMEAMAKPGDGTLKSRLEESGFRGKTGTLDSVSALSGYVKTGGGETVCVSLIVNHFLVSSSDVRAIADDFVREIEKWQPIGTVLDNQVQREVAVPLSIHRPAHGHWLHRPDRDSRPARAGAHR